MPSKLVLRSVCLVAVASLAACVVVPVDSRTGQPIGYPTSPPRADAPPPAVTLVNPSPAPAPAPMLLQGRLYPLNEAASQAGLLQAQVIDHQGGRGTLTLNYRGSTLHGEATRVDAGYAGFGRVHDQVLGPSRRDYAGRRGVANAFGGGQSVQCEYVITGAAIGTGACLFADGAKYQLHFGP
jgi:hypothetical protein